MLTCLKNIQLRKVYSRTLRNRLLLSLEVKRTSYCCAFLIEGGKCSMSQLLAPDTSTASPASASAPTKQSSNAEQHIQSSTADRSQNLVDFSFDSSVKDYFVQKLLSFALDSTSLCFFFQLAEQEISLSLQSIKCSWLPFDFTCPAK